MKLVKKFILIFLVITSLTKAQEIIDLYSGEIPNSKESTIKEEYKNGMFSNVTNPTLEIYPPEKEKQTGTAVVICPGGGYGVVVYEMEGIKTAKEFANNGVNAFLLKYRLPNDSIMIDKKVGPLQDALQAIKLVRENSEKWGIDKNKVGIMGFSAGGHLASTAATHFDMQIIENSNNINLRPDFQILIYPVISMQDKLTHLGSRENLLGKNPTQEFVDIYSNELQVIENTPPAYITHTGDDNVVDVANSLEYYKSLKKNDVPAEMHIYPKGNHGFVLSQPTEEWMEPIIKWLKKQN
ncbi:MAG: alpha/beta hydrolase [Ignavibacteriae bacterium]|nr:alpha/beta hydrolase [Ignavibacteriota bacterium]